MDEKAYYELLKLELIIRSGAKVTEAFKICFTLTRSSRPGRKLGVNAQDGRFRLDSAIVALSGVVQCWDCICCRFW